MYISTRFDLRNYPPSCQIKISAISSDVVSMLLNNEEELICEINEPDILELIKKDIKNKEFQIKTEKRRITPGDKILHVSYYRPKLEKKTTTGKLEYRLVNVSSS